MSRVGGLGLALGVVCLVLTSLVAGLAGPDVPVRQGLRDFSDPLTESLLPPVEQDVWIHKNFRNGRDYMPWLLEMWEPVRTIEEYEAAVAEYYGRQGIEVRDVSVEFWTLYCMAIECAGQVVYLLIDVGDVDEMRAIGYETGGP